MILGIFCAGSLGQEILSIVKRNNTCYEKIIFIDDVTDQKIISETEVWQSCKAFDTLNPSQLEIIIASGEPVYRERLFDLVKEKKFRMAKIICSNTVFTSDTNIDEGVVIFPNTYVGESVTIEANCIIHASCNIIEHARIKKHSFISNSSFIGSSTVVGEKNFIGPNASASDNLKIGDRVIAGMGSVIINDIENDTVVVGVPAKAIRRNESGIIFKAL